MNQLQRREIGRRNGGCKQDSDDGSTTLAVRVTGRVNNSLVTDSSDVAADSRAVLSA